MEIDWLIPRRREDVLATDDDASASRQDPFQSIYHFYKVKLPEIQLLPINHGGVFIIILPHPWGRWMQMNPPPEDRKNENN